MYHLEDASAYEPGGQLRHLEIYADPAFIRAIRVLRAEEFPCALGYRPVVEALVPEGSCNQSAVHIACGVSGEVKTKQGVLLVVRHRVDQACGPDGVRARQPTRPVVIRGCERQAMKSAGNNGEHDTSHRSSGVGSCGLGVKHGGLSEA